jgi:class 3 adenylate cyclase
MHELPTGVVTFLFADVEGSTRLLDELGAERYADVLAGHRRLPREFVRHGGVEAVTQRDAFFVAFAPAGDAIAAASAAQTGLPGALRMRRGVHTGGPLVADGGYVGMDVHRGARIAAAGHGGQVLVSETTGAVLTGTVPVKDRGEAKVDPASRAGYQETFLTLSDADFEAARLEGRAISLDGAVAYALDDSQGAVAV